MTLRLDSSTLRRLAVLADTDPRTIRKVFQGKAVRGAAGHRARRVLEAEGYLKNEFSPTSPR